MWARGGTKAPFPSPRTLCRWAGTFHRTNLEAGRSRAGPGGGNGRPVPRPLPPPAAGRARAAAGGRQLGVGRASRTGGRGRGRSRAPRAGPQVRAASRAGPRGPAEVSGPGKGQLGAAIPGMSGGPRGLEPRGAPLPPAAGGGGLPGGRRQEGCGRWKASPRGGAAVRVGSAGAGAWPGTRPLADRGIPWPRQSDRKGGCGRGAAGERGEPQGGGRKRRLGGPGGRGRGHPRRAVAAQRLWKSGQSSVPRDASGSSAPPHVSPRNWGSF